MHACDTPRRGHSRRALVVGIEGQQGMRDSRLAVSQTDRRTNTVSAMLQIDSTRINHLDWLESEAIHILREVAAECSNPALLFSGGKDSVVMLRLAEKAFRPGKFSFPLLHIGPGAH